MSTHEELTELSRLPDPSTLLFSTRSDAPAEGEPGRREAVEHWSFLAGRDGYTITPLDTRSGHGSATYCGDVDVDGLVYQVHRGPRQRVVQAWVDGEGAWQGRFVLDEAIWAVPVPPEPEPLDCPWCADGPPDTLRLAGSGTVGGIFSVWMAEHADGAGRGIVIEDDSHEEEPHTVCLEPAHSVVEAGLRGWALSDDELALQFTEDAASKLEIPDVMPPDPKKAGSSAYATRVPAPSDAENSAGGSIGRKPTSVCRKPRPSRQISTMVCKLTAAAAAAAVDRRSVVSSGSS